MNNPAHVIIGGLAIVILSVGTGIGLLRNEFVQDDVPLVLEDDRIRSLGNLWEMVSGPFWPDAGPAGHHRPAMTVSLALQWSAGEGSPTPFRIISLTLGTAAALAVFALALELVPFWWALAAGGAFAVHPVHVEALAVAINQGELLIAMGYALVLRWYIRYRRHRESTWSDRIRMATVMMVALMFKESGIVLPALLGASELCFANGRTARDRWQDFRPTLLLQVLVTAIVLAMRTAALGGEMRGTFTAEALEGLSMGGRALTMLAVVPEYLRLLFFPASLQADYSPGEILPATTFGSEQALGALLLGLIGVLLARSARSQPTITFAGLWTVIAIGPVSNVLVPSGIVLAERTLYLASIGAVLVLAGVITATHALLASEKRQIAQLATGAVVSAMILLGASRSHSRVEVWRNQRTFWTQTVVDAPRSYRAMLAVASLLTHPTMSLRFMERGLDEWKNPAAMFALSSRLQQSNDCVAASQVAREALAIKEYAPGRSEFLACLTWEGRYEEARVEALQGLRSGSWHPVFRRWLHWLDSVRVEAPPAHTVIAPAQLHLLWPTKEVEPDAFTLQPPLPPPGPPWVGR